MSNRKKTHRITSQDPPHDLLPRRGAAVVGEHEQARQGQRRHQQRQPPHDGGRTPALGTPERKTRTMATLDGYTVLLLRTTDSGAKVAQLRQKNKLKEGRSRRTNDDNLGSLAVIGVIDCEGGLFVSASWQPSFFRSSTAAVPEEFDAVACPLWSKQCMAWRT